MSEWKSEGSCVGIDPALFFSPEARDLRDARKVCANCPVQEECLEHALAHEPHGTWAGTSERQRVELRKRRGLKVSSPKAWKNA
jgi:WhiB family redox-sensing transcriptional regulator